MTESMPGKISIEYVSDSSNVSAGVWGGGLGPTDPNLITAERLWAERDRLPREMTIAELRAILDRYEAEDTVQIGCSSTGGYAWAGLKIINQVGQESIMEDDEKDWDND